MSIPSLVLDISSDDSASDRDGGRQVGVGNTEPPPPPGRGRKAQGWCFTINNPSIAGQALLDLVKSDSRVKYVVFSLEEGEQGTRHFQGYLYLNNTKSMNVVKEILGRKAHLEIARGNPKQNKEYCTKAPLDGPWEFGELPQKGKRSDLTDFIKEIREGRLTSFRAVVESDYASTGVRMMRQTDRLLQMYQRRTQKPTVEVYWGDSGTGKSKKAWEDHPDAYAKPDGIWWDNYNGEDVVIWDDFDDVKYPLQEWLKITDRYKVSGQIKGGFVALTWTKIIFTSNIDPKEWYPAAIQAHKEAIKRRIDKVEHFISPF